MYYINKETRNHNFSSIVFQPSLSYLFLIIEYFDIPHFEKFKIILLFEK